MTVLQERAAIPEPVAEPADRAHVPVASSSAGVYMDEEVAAMQSTVAYEYVGGYFRATKLQRP